MRSNCSGVNGLIRESHVSVYFKRNLKRKNIRDNETIEQALDNRRHEPYIHNKLKYQSRVTAMMKMGRTDKHIVILHFITAALHNKNLYLTKS